MDRINIYIQESNQTFRVHSQISCLLATCRSEMDNESEEDNSSLEIYLTLADQLSEEDLKKQRLRMLQERQALQDQKQQMAIMPRRPQHVTKMKPISKPQVITDVTDDIEPTVTFFDNMVKESERRTAYSRTDYEETEILHDLIRVEEIFIATMIAKCLKLCPSAFENEITKDEIMSLINRASRFLWTNVGGTLEHYLLWWAQFPLACRPVSCSKYLREYLMLIQPDDAPEPILSTLKSLGEILTVHAGESLRRSESCCCGGGGRANESNSLSLQAWKSICRNSFAFSSLLPCLYLSDYIKTIPSSALTRYKLQHKSGRATRALTRTRQSWLCCLVGSFSRVVRSSFRWICVLSCRYLKRVELCFFFGDEVKWNVC